MLSATLEITATLSVLALWGYIILNSTSNASNALKPSQEASSVKLIVNVLTVYTLDPGTVIGKSKPYIPFTRMTTNIRHMHDQYLEDSQSFQCIHGAMNDAISRLKNAYGKAADAIMPSQYSASDMCLDLVILITSRLRRLIRPW